MVGQTRQNRKIGSSNPTDSNVYTGSDAAANPATNQNAATDSGLAADPSTTPYQPGFPSHGATDSNVIGYPVQPVVDNDPNSLQNQALQQAEIDKFGTQMPFLKQQMTGDILAAGKRSIAQRQAEAKGALGRRGLLWGGTRQKTNADIEAETAAKASKSTSAITSALENEQEQMKDVLNQMRLNKWTSDVAQADAAYKRALEEYRSQLDLFGKVGGAFGGILGAAL